MSNAIAGIHHITAVASDPQALVDFYEGILGQRMVKKTVNFDDPGTYHLYFGNGTGDPGTILTFFPWPGARPGSAGLGQAITTAYRVPAGALGYWAERLTAHRVAFEGPSKRFSESFVRFRDPDGMVVELIEEATSSGAAAWIEGPVPEAQAIRGFHSTALCVNGYESSARLLTDVMGLALAGEEDGRFRFATAANVPGNVVDVVCQPGSRIGTMGAGTIHHVAWRVDDVDDQTHWRDRLLAAGHNPTPILDRQYFKSIYFREPGGVLFEFATDPPGFSVDEDSVSLGDALKLPPWLESERARIEQRLPKLDRPAAS